MLADPSCFGLKSQFGFIRHELSMNSDHMWLLHFVCSHISFLLSQVYSNLSSRV